MPIDPTFSVGGPEWQIAPVAPSQESGPTHPGSGAFGDMLGKSIQSLTTSQEEASQAAQALATGQASDPTQVVMAVERAQLAMQLASQIRDKAVEATQTIFHTQV
jgi:flagellar hook-basal body complex protein FliE